MTLIAGIVGRTPGWTVPDAFRSAIINSLSRNPNEQLLEIARSGAHFVKVDINAYDTRSVIDTASGPITMMTGDPLFPAKSGSLDRLSAARKLHSCPTPHRTEILKTARGVFSGVNFNPETGVVSLYTDKLGLRPIYYTITDEYVVFASVLRVLEAFPHHHTEMDAIGVTEIIALGIPLGARTPYTHISVLEAAELLDIGPASVTQTKYWSWHTIPEADSNKPDELLDRAYDVFVDSVRQRIAQDKVTVSYLSGGLDSRCVVATLRMLGVDVHTFSFAHEPNEDQYFAAQFAARVGSVHHQCVTDSGAPKWGTLMSDAWSAADYGNPLAAEHPKLVWTGDGGSVGTGFVYLSETIVDRLRRGEPSSAISAYLEQQRAAIPRRLLTPSARGALTGILESEIGFELDRVPCSDPARSFYFFLLLNDQRRHLAQHFENIDLHRLEYQLPFFDSEFLAVTASIPLNWGLRHQFYSDWLKRFPDTTTAVPWQTYPGHVPCPLKKPTGLIYQWDESIHSQIRRRRRLRTASQGLHLALSPDFPTSLILRRNLNAAVLVHASGLRDYEYLINAAQTYVAYWSKSGRRHSLEQ